jgi:hypothetical protein
MTSNPVPAVPPREQVVPAAAAVPERARPARERASRSRPAEPATSSRTDPRPAAIERRPATDYASTRLVNFRLPVDLHDRYKQLVRDTEDRHPRLRHPSLTELLIALLEEGPQTADEVAELIRRKRASEHGAQP